MVVGRAASTGRIAARGGFDIDWAAGGGRLLVPVLGDDADLGRELDGRRRRELRYHDHALPDRARHRRRLAVEVHDRQHYELVSWRRGGRRAQLPALLRGQHAGRGPGRGPRGLRGHPRRDRALVRRGPGRRAAGRPPRRPARPGSATSTTWPSSPAAPTSLVEKILEPGEELPASWATAGTTGYDALAHDRPGADRPGRRGALDELETQLRGGPVDWHQLIHDTKRAVADGILSSEVRRIVREARRGSGGRDRAIGELRRRGRRAAGLLPGLPLLPARGSRPPRPGVRAGARAPARPRRRARRARAGAGRPRCGRPRSGSSRPAAW